MYAPGVFPARGSQSMRPYSVSYTHLDVYKRQIKDADLILVMKDGDIIEQGTHDALLKKGGFYADLYNSQFAAPTVEAS